MMTECEGKKIAGMTGKPERERLKASNDRPVA